MATMNRVVRFARIGGPEVLSMTSQAMTPPAAAEVRIAVRAIGLNRSEIMLRSGGHVHVPPLPSGLGFEAAGIIDAVGDGVEGFAPGDVVSVLPSLSMTRWPSYAEYADFPADLVVRHPAHLSFEQAAAARMQYVTAAGALADICPLHPGNDVLITAASSSVGLAAIQGARLRGARPIAATRSQAKVDALRAAGAAEVIVTNDEDLPSRVRDITGGAGARVAFDAVGGPALAQLCEALSVRGTLIQYGALDAAAAAVPTLAIIAKSLTLRGFRYSEIIGDEARRKRLQALIVDGLNSGALTPIIARVFPFERIADAHRYMEGGTQIGKVVVRV